MSETKKKQSLVMGALTGSAGILITKIISLLYVIPFNEIAQEETTFYAYGYSVYNSLLEVCLSGLPFAIATLVSKYMALEDYDTVLRVKKVSGTLISAIGTAFCIVMIAFAGPITRSVIPEGSSQLVYDKTRTVMIIVAFALIFVPILSFYRGYYQGLKDMKVYAFTQVLEQLSRVAFLLGASALCVYVFNKDRIWAVYMAIAGASLGAIFTILYFIFYDKKANPVIGDDTESSHSTKEVLKELVLCAIPYLLSSLMGASGNLLIMTLFPKGLSAYGMSAEDIVINQGLLNYQCSKLSGIPMIVMTAFCVSMVPHITEAITQKDMEKVKTMINRILESALYLTIPICAFMFFFAKEIYYVIYGSYELQQGSSLLMSYAVNMIFMNLMGIMATVMVAVGKKKLYTMLEIGRIIILIPSLYFSLKFWGIQGYFIGISLEQFLFSLVCLLLLQKDGKTGLLPIVRTVGITLLSCIPMGLAWAAVKAVGFDATTLGRIGDLVFCGITGVATVALFALISSLFKTPQKLLGIDSFKELVKRFIKK